MRQQLSRARQLILCLSTSTACGPEIAVAPTALPAGEGDPGQPIAAMPILFCARAALPHTRPSWPVTAILEQGGALLRLGVRDVLVTGRDPDLWALSLLPVGASIDGVPFEPADVALGKCESEIGGEIMVGVYPGLRLAFDLVSAAGSDETIRGWVQVASDVPREHWGRFAAVSVLCLPRSVDAEGDPVECQAGVSRIVVDITDGDGKVIAASALTVEVEGAHC